MRLIFGAALLLSIALAACQAPLRPTAALPTAAGPQSRSTLPPTWTPSFTPTVTRTPTATLTPSLTPTLSADEICAGFELLYDFTLQRQYSSAGYIPILLNLPSPDTMVRFTATHSETEESNGFELPGGQALGMEFHMSALPGPGEYDWRLVVDTEAYGEICALEGEFTVVAPTATPFGTSAATANPAHDYGPALARLIERWSAELPE